MGWLNKYPDGGAVKPPKTKIQPINFVRQDNLRQLPMFDQKAIADFNSPENIQARAVTKATYSNNTKDMKEKELARRRTAIAKSNTEGGFKNSAVAEKMRLFPNDVGGWGEVVDDYINPLKFIGSMADDIGHAKSAKELVTAIAQPVAMGIINGIPTKKTNFIPQKLERFDLQKTPISDRSLPFDLIEEAVNKTKKGLARDLDKVNKYREFRADGENWKIGEELSNIGKNPSFNTSYISTRDLAEAKYAAELQKKISPFNSTVYTGMDVGDLSKAANKVEKSGSNWYGGMRDNRNAHYVSDFGDYKMNPKLNTYEAAKNAARADAGEYFQSRYKDFIMNPLDHMSLPKNKNGGTITNKWLNNY